MVTVTFTDGEITHTVHTKGEVLALINIYFREEKS